MVVFAAGHFESVARVAAGMEDLCVETHRVWVMDCGFRVRWYDWLSLWRTRGLCRGSWFP